MPPGHKGNLQICNIKTIVAAIVNAAYSLTWYDTMLIHEPFLVGSSHWFDLEGKALPEFCFLGTVCERLGTNDLSSAGHVPPQF